MNETSERVQAILNQCQELVNILEEGALQLSKSYKHALAVRQYAHINPNDSMPIPFLELDEIDNIRIALHLTEQFLLQLKKGQGSYATH